MYEAASRAVLHQREPDGTKKNRPTHPLQAVASPSAGTHSTYSCTVFSQPACCALCVVQHTEGKGAGHTHTSTASGIAANMLR